MLLFYHIPALFSTVAPYRSRQAVNFFCNEFIGERAGLNRLKTMSNYRRDNWPVKSREK
jgi:hypothetical protein